MKDFKEKANLIWSVADVLRGDYKQADYGKVILPLTVLRRLDCVLERTKQKVLDFLPKVEGMSVGAMERALNKVAGLSFHNRSPYNFKKLVADPGHLAANLSNFINGFSVNAREIIEFFNFNDHISRLDAPGSEILFLVVKKFEEIDLSDMKAMEMGYVFEDLIRRFSELSNETAGEHFTPREVIRLMVNLLFGEDRDTLVKEGIVKTLYDPACGTGGMLSVADEYLQELNPGARLELFGQEVNPESYAICKSDMLIKGQNTGNIKFGNTFTVDGLADHGFDYMLSNPPFGVEWRKVEKYVREEHDNKGYAGRFGPGLPRINDGSLLFLMHMIAKMKRTEAGSRIGIVFNGSPLFTGSAGSGESEIRRWIIENDLLEAIVALPDQLFYNTGITTYIWIIANQKSQRRKGKVQLIDVSQNGFWIKMARSLGNKRKEIGDGRDGKKDQIGEITRIYGEFREGPYCKIFPNEYFGYWRVPIERPLKDENGEIVRDKNGNKKPDASLRDYENVPLMTDRGGTLRRQSIEEYFSREVEPHVPDAWMDFEKVKKGYEINFTRYFYQFKPLRSLEDIRQDILTLEKETEGLLQAVISE